MQLRIIEHATTLNSCFIHQYLVSAEKIQIHPNG